eukprot:213756_1
MILLMRKIEHHKENVANGDALSYPEIALLLNKRKAANKQRRQLNALKRTMKEYPPPKKYPFDSDNLNTSDCVISSIAFIDQLIVSICKKTDCVQVYYHVMQYNLRDDTYVGFGGVTCLAE